MTSREWVEQIVAARDLILKDALVGEFAVLMWMALRVLERAEEDGR